MIVSLIYYPALIFRFEEGFYTVILHLSISQGPAWRHNLPTPIPKPWTTSPRCYTFVLPINAIVSRKPGITLGKVNQNAAIL